MIRLSEAGKESRDTIGGKSLRLAQMWAAGFLVKPAVILTTEEVQDILVTGRVPNSTLIELRRFLNLGGAGVAVRSSAGSEDGKLSWAGQFRSRLFIEEASLEIAILDCASAQHEEQVRAYAQTHNEEIPFLALAVQEMVDAETAGVLYTCDPITGDSGFMVIEAVAGVAEGLVSGQTNPKRYILNAETAEIVIEEGSPLPELTETQLKQLVSVGYRLRELFGAEQDVEWAVEKNTNKVFVNQSRDNTGRPIAAPAMHRLLSASNLQHELKLEAHRLQELGCSLLPNTLTNQNIIELLTPHPTQMAFGLFTYGFAHGEGGIRRGRNEIGYEIGEELSGGFFRLVAGQPMCSIAHDAFTYRIKGIPLDDYCQLVNHYLRRVAEDPTLANYPELNLYNQNPDLSFLARMFGRNKAEAYSATYRKFLAGISKLEDSLVNEYHREFLPRWDITLQECEREAAGNIDITQLTSIYQDVLETFRTFACPMYVKVARLAFFVDVRLRALLRELFGEKAEAYYNTLVSGTSPEINPLLGFAPALRAWHNGQVSTPEILSKYGHLGDYEMEISRPRYREYPDLLAKLAENLMKGQSASFEGLYESFRTLREELVRKSGIRGCDLDREIRVARTYQPLREVAKYHFLKAYDLLRRISLRLAELAAWEPGLIFHVDPREIPLMKSALNKLSEMARTRCDIWEAQGNIFVPPVIHEEDFGCIGRIPDSLNSTFLQGTPVSNAVAEGEVIVIRDLGDPEGRSLIKGGCILVTEATCQAWSMYLDIVGPKGGIVTEFGGQLAHAAMYCRERNLAGAVGVALATRRLKTGMWVRVDGTQGTVEILP